MSFVGDFLGNVVGGITGASQAADAASAAAGTQAASAQSGIEEQRRQFDAIVKMMSPYLQAGESALGQQQTLLGLRGASDQQSAINQLQQSPFFQAQLQQGQNAMLQNASATGGLRGGNTQAAMGMLAPQLLNQTYQQQLAQLGGLSQLGQSSAGLQANAGQASAANIANLYGQQGAALAGGQMAQGGVAGSSFNTLLQGAGLFAGVGGMPGISKLF
ncbi:MAG: hypothetical protein WC464_00020 [Bdellovibrionales bacterium]